MVTEIKSPTKKQPKVFVVGNSSYMIDRLVALFGDHVSQPEDANVMLFTGGADITPAMYGETGVHSRTTTHLNRDAEEILAFYRHSLTLGNASVGICRGAQFLSVMNGCKLWQDVDNHRIEHDLKDLESGNTYRVTSNHHQQIRFPVKKNKTAKLLAVGVFEGKPTTKESSTTKTITDTPDIEAMWFSDTSCLAYQPHPEYGSCPDTRALFLHYIDKYVIRSLNS